MLFPGYTDDLVTAIQQVELAVVSMEMLEQWHQVKVPGVPKQRRNWSSLEAGLQLGDIYLLARESRTQGRSGGHRRAMGLVEPAGRRSANGLAQPSIPHGDGRLGVGEESKEDVKDKSTLSGIRGSRLASTQGPWRSWWISLDRASSEPSQEVTGWQIQALQADPDGLTQAAEWWTQAVDKPPLTDTCTEEDLMQSSPQRRSYVRQIDLVMLLDPYGIEARGRFETDEEQKRDNEIFTRTIRKPFRILKSWPEEEEDDDDVDVDRSGIYLSIRPDEANKLLDKRLEKSYLRFTDGSLDEIPELPRLPYFNAFVYDNEKRDLTLRKRTRNEFALR
ncbi:hypothetical protein VTN00DRAFT_3794 [Thermoascus crustaceus]|uniref:uncharacterized protein n=1 Tax=Thermoascus crustaceus TaxID=5088 RepID=UPI003743F7DE